MILSSLSLLLFLSLSPILSSTLPPTYWKEQMTLFPDEPNLKSCYALSLIREQRLDEGMPILLEGIEKNPADWVAWEYIGGTYGSIARTLFQYGKVQRGHEFLYKAIDAFAKGYESRINYSERENTKERGNVQGIEIDLGEYPQSRHFAMPLSLSLRGWGDALLWIGNEEKSQKVYLLGVKHGLWKSPLCRPEVLLSTLSLSASHFGVLSPTSSHFPYIFDISLFPHLSSLVASLEQITSELYSLSDPSLWMTESAGLHSEQSWTQLPFLANGYFHPICQHSPFISESASAHPNLPFSFTCSLIQSIPSFFLRSGQVKFSSMLSGTRVRPHAGPVNSRLRIHCALRVPPELERSWIKVGDQILHWKEGKCFVFDESCQHEVSIAEAEGGQRVVLVADFANPFLSEWADYEAALHPSVDMVRARDEFDAFQKLHFPSWEKESEMCAMT